jgi:alkylhydroperoxidase family enzyme
MSERAVERANEWDGRDRRLPEPPPGVSRQSVEPWQDPAIAAGLDDWQNAVMRLDALDPVTTEVVRLRCATNHDCRFCRTVRLEVDGARAIDEATAGLVARSEAEALTSRHAAAMRLADAMMTQPGWIDDELVVALHRNFTPAELLEMSLDVMKFSHQKIKVALGLDEPMRPDGGLVDFAIDAAGRPAFGVPK